MEEFLNPEKILKKLNLKEDQIAVDFGSGSGGWVIPLAKILTKGKVFAVDILKEPLSALKSRAKLERLVNIFTVEADVEKPLPLASNLADLILMTNLLFEVDNKEAVFKEAKRILKKDGKILVVDWKEDSPIGPEKKVSIKDIREIAQKEGFSLEKEFPAGKFHFALIFSKIK